MNKRSLPLVKLNFESDFGTISLCANEDGITHLNFIPQINSEWLSREVDNQLLENNRVHSAIDSVSESELEQREFSVPLDRSHSTGTKLLIKYSENEI